MQRLTNSWHRRAALLGLPVAVAVALFLAAAARPRPTTAAPGAPPPRASVAAGAADAFVDSVGVNIHLAYGPTAYGTSFDKVLAALRELGVRHVRDNVVNVPALYRDAGLVVERWHELNRAGIQVTMIAQIARPATEMVDLALRESAAVEAVEGPNEHNVLGGPDWAAALRVYQMALYQTAKQKKLAAPIIAPSVSWPDFALALRGLEAFADFGNIHSYPGGRPQATDFARFVAGARQVSGAKPIVATETGYHSAVETRDAHLPASQRAAALYLPRLLAHYYNAGIKRTFIYQLVDDVVDRGLSNPEGHFGLLDASFRRTPAYAAVANLLAILRDPGPGFTPGVLGLQLRTRGASVDSLVLQKRDGRFYLLLWSATYVYDVERRRDVANPPLATEAQFGSSMQRVRLFRPNVAARPQAEWRDVARVSVPVGDDLAILEITPTLEAR